MIRIRLEACEGDESYVFDGLTVAAAIADCVHTVSIGCGQLTDVATLLHTLAKAISLHEEGAPPIAREWDFSIPEAAYYIMFFDDSEDDDGTDCATVWANADGGLDKAVRDIVSPGWDRVEA
jgi:hypothetical protein